SSDRATGVVTGASIGSINSSFAHNAFGELSSLRTDAAEGALLSQILSQVLSRDRLGCITALSAAPKIAAAIVAAARWLVLPGAKRGTVTGAGAMIETRTLGDLLVAGSGSNVASSFSNQYGNFVVKESLFSRRGWFLKCQSPW